MNYKDSDAADTNPKFTLMGLTPGTIVFVNSKRGKVLGVAEKENGIPKKYLIKFDDKTTGVHSKAEFEKQIGT